jgi:hypothetical protein
MSFDLMRSQSIHLQRSKSVLFPYKLQTAAMKRVVKETTGIQDHFICNLSTQYKNNENPEEYF